MHEPKEVTKQTHTRKQKTKQDNSYHIEDNIPIASVTPTDVCLSVCLPAYQFVCLTD
jgi:hypothetical protein